MQASIERDHTPQQHRVQRREHTLRDKFQIRICQRVNVHLSEPIEERFRQPLATTTLACGVLTGKQTESRRARERLTNKMQSPYQIRRKKRNKHIKYNTHTNYKLEHVCARICVHACVSFLWHSQQLFQFCIRGKWQNICIPDRARECTLWRDDPKRHSDPPAPIDLPNLAHPATPSRLLSSLARRHLVT